LSAQLKGVLREAFRELSEQSRLIAEGLEAS
jgi:hypothetical protein